MGYSHRNNDGRSCGATTIVSGQDFVKINGQLWAVQDDPDSHGEGGLVPSKNYVTIGGKAIIIQNDSANPDSLCPTDGGNHCDPMATGYDALVSVK